MSNNIYGYGVNNNNELNITPNVFVTIPTDSGMSGIKAINCPNYGRVGSTSFFLDNSGFLYWTGAKDGILPNTLSQIGTEKYKDISAGDAHILLLRKDNTLWAMGDGTYGQLGQGNTTSVLSAPVQIGNDSNWTQIGCGDDFCLAFKNDFVLYVWGRNNVYQLGVGDTLQKNSPVPNSGVQGYGYKIECGARHSIIWKNRLDYYNLPGPYAEMWGFGDNTDFQLGNSQYPFLTLNNNNEWVGWGVPQAQMHPYVTQATNISQASQCVSLSCGDKHSAFIPPGGSSIYFVGDNTYGQLDQGVFGGVVQNWTVGVSPPSGVNYIKCGKNTTFVITNTKQLFGAGKNDNHELGLPTTINYNTFQLINPTVDFSFIYPGPSTFAIANFSAPTTTTPIPTTSTTTTTTAGPDCGTQSVIDSILNAIQAEIQSVSCLPTCIVKKRAFMADNESVPLIIVAPLRGEVDNSYYRIFSQISYRYSIIVSLIQPGNRQFVAGIDQNLATRQALRNAISTIRISLPNGFSVWNQSYVQSDPIYIPMKNSTANYQISSFELLCEVMEPQQGYGP